MEYIILWSSAFFYTLKYWLCLFSFNSFLLARIYSLHTPGVQFSLTNEQPMQLWRAQAINQVAKTVNFEAATASATQHIFDLSLLMKFGKALQYDYTEHDH